MDDESSSNRTLQASSVQKDVINLSTMCSLRSRELQAQKRKNPSANAGVSINSVVARGGIDQGRGFSTLIETFVEIALLG